MEVKQFLFIIITVIGLAACNGQGTEVLSPSNPNENPGPRKIETPLYEVTMNLPAGWTYIEYGPDVTPGSEAFKDIDPDTITVAQFDKGPSGFTIFFSTLAAEQTLESFVRERRPLGEIQLEKVSDEENAYVALFNQEEPGPHGGFVVDFYASVNQYVLWMRAEAVGTPQEQENVLNEFFGLIVPSIEFQPKI